MATAYDEVDVELISLLKENARRSNTEIASALGVSETAVRKRVSRLLEKNLLRIVPWLNPPQAGFTTAMITMSVDLTCLSQVSEQLAALPEIFYCAVVTGPFDIIASVMVRSEQELYDFLKQKVASIEGIRSTQTSIILDIAKFDYSPEILAHPEMPKGRKRQR